MANLNARLGFRPVSNGIAGTAPRLTQYTALTNIAIGEGDLVGINTTGEIIAYTATDADAGDVIGVAAHPLVAAQSDRSLIVYDDPEQLYEAQVDDATLTNASLFMFKYFDANKSTLNTTTLQSKQQIDGNTGTAALAAANVVQIVGVSGAINNTANTTYTRYICRIVPQAHIRSASAGDNATHVAGIG